MDVKTTQKLLADQNIKATEAEILSAISADDLADLAESDITFVSELLKKSVAIAPVAETKPARRGGKVAKTQQKGLSKPSEPQQIEYKTVAVSAPNAASAAEAHLVSEIQEFYENDTEFINLGSEMVAQHIAAKSTRFWSAVEQKVSTRGINKSSELVEARRQVHRGSLTQIASMINQSNEALGIAGRGFDVELTD